MFVASIDRAFELWGGGEGGGDSFLCNFMSYPTTFGIQPFATKERLRADDFLRTVRSCSTTPIVRVKTTSS